MSGEMHGFFIPKESVQIINIRNVVKKKIEELFFHVKFLYKEKIYKY